MTDLDAIRRTPLGKIQPGKANEVIRSILKRGAAAAPVEVARFGSVI